MTAIERVETATGSHIVPPLDSAWSDLERLRWKAEVVALDSGLTIAVVLQADAVGEYMIVVGRGSATPFGFSDAAWSLFFEGLPWKFIKPLTQITVAAHHPHPKPVMETAAKRSTDRSFVATSRRHLKAWAQQP